MSDLEPGMMPEEAKVEYTPQEVEQAIKKTRSRLINIARRKGIEDIRSFLLGEESFGEVRELNLVEEAPDVRPWKHVVTREKGRITIRSQPQFPESDLYEETVLLDLLKTPLLQVTTSRLHDPSQGRPIASVTSENNALTERKAKKFLDRIQLQQPRP